MLVLARPRRIIPSFPPSHSLIMAEEIRAQSYVGFDSITQQIEHKLLKRGFQFNVIVVGTCLISVSNLAGKEVKALETGKKHERGGN